jgi:hypothetical protein
MRIVRLVQIAALALLATASHARQPTDAESDAFIKAYSFDILTTLADEALAFKVESGQLSKELAHCVRGRLHLNLLLVQARPIVAASFRDAQTLNETTAFFLSPTGTKMKDFNKATLKDFLRRKLRGQPPVTSPPVPPSFTQKDVEIAGAFNYSSAGQDFGRFVQEGLPKLRRFEELEPVLAACRAANINLLR